MMTFDIFTWEPPYPSAWRWYWFIEAKRDRVLVAVINQPHHEPPYETKSLAHAAAERVLGEIRTAE